MGFETMEAAERWYEAAEFRADQLKEERMLAEEKPAYTGRERRWTTSRAWSGWQHRDDHFANQEALKNGQSAYLLMKMRDRLKDPAKKDAMWDGYWYVKEQRDKWRERVSQQVAPWFDGSAFA